jgi:hypothetical protein
MRLSVVAVSVVLLFSQSTLAQHSSGGGGSSGGGSAGSSSGSGGGSHGGGGSSGGSSGGHVSGGGSGSQGSGSFGSTHVTTSSRAASGFVHGPETVKGPAGELAPYSSLHGESSEVHNQLLDQALAKLQYALPANFKNGQPFSAKSLKRIEPALDRKAETKPKVRKEESDRKPCHGHHCHPRPVTEYCTLGTSWSMSQDLYTTIQGDCRHLAANLAQEESKVAVLQAGQSSTCDMNPVGSACASATSATNKLNAKIGRLHNGAV